VEIHLSWDGDKIGRQVGRAALEDDENKLRQISHAVDRGNAIWRSWVESKGGAIISYGGDEGRAKIGTRHLGDIPRVRHEYQTMVGSTVTIGVGQKLSEADRALICGKLRGGDQVVLYTPEIEHEIKAAKEKHGKRDEVDKLSEEYLDDQHEIVKAEGTPPMAQGPGGAGMEGAKQPQKPKTPEKPAAEASEHSEGEAARNFAEENDPGSPEKSHTPEEMEQAFHDAAAGSDADDEPQGEDQHTVVAKVVQVLQDVRKQAPVIAKLKEAAPDAYEAVMEMVASMIEIARSVGGGKAVKKSEEDVEFKQAAFKDTRDGHVYPAGSFHDTSVLPEEYSPDFEDGFIDAAGDFFTRAQATEALDADQPVQSEDILGKSEDAKTVYRIENDTGDGPYKAGALTPDNHPNRPTAHEDFSPEVFQAMDEKGWKFAFESPDQATSWFGPETMRTLTKKGFKLVGAKAAQVHRSKSGKQVIYEPVEDLDKANLPMPHANPHSKVQWPVGAVNTVAQDHEAPKAPHIKVQHKDGAAPAKTGWVQAQAGQILSRDGHAISSRNPGGK
jgi:hypothetical protein